MSTLASTSYTQLICKLHKILFAEATAVFCGYSRSSQAFLRGLGAAAYSLGMKNIRKNTESLLLVVIRTHLALQRALILKQYRYKTASTTQLRD